MSCTALVLGGLFWVTTGPPKFCVPLRNWELVPRSIELVAEQEVDTVYYRVRARYAVLSGLESELSERSQPFKSIKPNVHPDVDGNGYINEGDLDDFIADFKKGDPSRFDFDGNGAMTAADINGFNRIYGGQVLK